MSSPPRRRLIALAAAASVAVAGAALWWHSHGGADRAGPLACRGCATISVSLPVKTGQLVVASDMHVGGHRYAAVYPYLVRLCAWPRAPLTHRCDGLPTELLQVSPDGERAFRETTSPPGS